MQSTNDCNGYSWLTCPLNRAYQTPVFEILAGPSEEVFYAHAGVLAQSKVLQLQVAGWGSETQERKIRWPQWNADIVERFLEWLYTGDYSIPFPTEARRVAVPEQSEAGMPESNDVKGATDQAIDEDFAMELQEEEWNMPVQPERNYLPPHMRAVKPSASSPAPSATPIAKGPLTALEDLEWKGSHAVQKTSRAEEFTNRMNNQLASSKQFDYDATFMTHATLYVIGCEKDLHELKNMAWQRLRSLLVSIGSPTAGTPVIANMVALIQYTYKETGVSELPVDPMRDLATSYVAIYFTKFNGAEVDALLASQAADDREFVVEVMAKVRQSMEDLEATKTTTGSSGTVYSSPAFKKDKKKGKISCSVWGD